MRRVVPLLALCGSLACSGQQTPGPLGKLTPAPLEAGAPRVARAVASTEPERFSLEKFAPLLGRPELAKAAKAVENNNYALAAREVAAVMHKTPPAGADVVRFQFLLGRLRERAGDIKGALASYQLAAKDNWALVGYARLAAGRMALRSGQAKLALSLFEHVPGDLPIRSEQRLLLAEAADRLGERNRAIEAYRLFLSENDASDSFVDVALRLAGALLARAKDVADDGKTISDGDVIEALHLARKAEFRAIATPSIQLRAGGVVKRALAQLPADQQKIHSALSPEEQLMRISGLLSAGNTAPAHEAAEALISTLPPGQKYEKVGCEAMLLRGKALASDRDYGKAVDSYVEPAKRCKDEDLKAKILYLAGKYAASDGRHAQAVKYFEQLERELPHHRLSDDARLKAALSYFELGSEARFTELLSKMPEDYPEGDMVLDGIFRLALRRVEKGDWSGAAQVLDRGSALVKGRDSARGTEYSGRERYFRARAWMETGEKERGMAELEAIIAELPLSYYMLHAYARLVELDPFRAKKARDGALERSRTQPFSIEFRPELETAGFRRALELLRQSEFDQAKNEIQALGIAKPGAAPEILWAIALLYAKAGSAKLSHAVARGLLTDWLDRWPVGTWVQAWELAFPRPYPALVAQQSKLSGVPETLIYAVMREESAFDPDAESPAGAHGLMQLIVPTAKLVAKGLPYNARALKNPRVNVTLGSRALAGLLKRFDQNPLLAVPGYNAGPGRPARWLRERPHADFDVWVELIPYTETRRYTKRVLASRAAYSYLYDHEQADAAMALPLKLSP